MKMYTYSLAAVLSASFSFSVQAMDDLAASASSPCQVRVEVPGADAEQAAVLAELVATVTGNFPGFDASKCPEKVFLGVYILSVLSNVGVAGDVWGKLVDKLDYSPLSAPAFSVWILDFSEDYFWSRLNLGDLRALNQALRGC